MLIVIYVYEVAFSVNDNDGYDDHDEDDGLRRRR
jgi:hypothetical protein